MYRNTFRIFEEISSRELFDNKISNIRARIERENENYILNVNERDYVKYIKTENLIEVAELYFDEVCIDDYEKQIPAECFPQHRFHVLEGKHYPKRVFVYHIPFEGDINFFRLQPGAGRLIWSQDTFIQDKFICFEVINFYDDSEEIKKEAGKIIENIKKNYLVLRSECDNFNSNLEVLIKDILLQVKKTHLKNQSFRASLGVPLKKKENIAETFAVPRPKIREKVKVTKPEIIEKAFEIDPTLDEENYLEILKIINDVGKNFERMPSTFKDKDEESLRDHILLVLEPNFEGGTATGETFNKSGKTDILLRYESSNVFVAECKFWKGEKNYLKAIDQLLEYLTWRDSKTALIIFVKNRDLSSILGKILETTKSHTNYKEFIDKTSDTWFNFILHLTGDSNREIKLAVMIFHLPDK